MIWREERVGLLGFPLALQQKHSYTSRQTQKQAVQHECGAKWPLIVSLQGWAESAAVGRFCVITDWFCLVTGHIKTRAWMQVVKSTQLIKNLCDLAISTVFCFNMIIWTDLQVLPFCHICLKQHFFNSSGFACVHVYYSHDSKNS